MEASVFLGGGWLEGSGDEASQSGPADGAHRSSPRDAGSGPAHAAALQSYHPAVCEQTYQSTSGG